MNQRLLENIKKFETKQKIVGLLSLLIILSLSVLMNDLMKRNSAEQTARMMSRMIKIGDLREVSLTLEDSSLYDFKSIIYLSSQKKESVYFPASAEYGSEKSSYDFLLNAHLIIPIGKVSGDPDAKIVFEYNRFALTLYGFAFWLILILVSFPQTRIMKNRLLAQFASDQKIEIEVARANIARIVRHNIRTPLVALLRLSETMDGIKKDESELLESIITHIRSVIEGLNENADSQIEKNSESFYSSLRFAYQQVKAVTPERIHLSFEMDDQLVSAKINFNPVELKSIIFNLVNNAADAIAGDGQIRIVVKDCAYKVTIEVIDDGIGISEVNLTKIFDSGFSFGKVNGSGVGLFHAQTLIKQWQGKIDVKSTLGKGTAILLEIPISDRANWYVSRVKLKNSDTVVVIDDQPAIHKLWNIRLRESGFKGLVYNFINEAALVKAQMPTDKSIHYFVDYDLGSESGNGVSLISRLPKEPNKFLVTGNFDQKEILELCEKNALPLIPKTQLSDLRILVVG
jgi:signal transduction histidine kinase